MTEMNKLIEDTERLLAAADPAPWKIHPTYSTNVYTEWRKVAGCERGTDAALIAHAPAALRALVDEVKRLRNQVAKLEFERTPQPNADWERNSVSVDSVRPQLPVRVCTVCRDYAVAGPADQQGEHHPACEQATVAHLITAGAWVSVAQVKAWTIDESAQAELWASCVIDEEGAEAPMRPIFTYPPLDLWCVECHCMQFNSPGGACCVNGHGGAEGRPKNAGPRYRSPAAYEGSTRDSNGDPV